jgi:hypothetical protein
MKITDEVRIFRYEIRTENQCLAGRHFDNRSVVADTDL